MRTVAKRNPSTTAKRKRSTAAPGQYLGYATQTTRFLVRLLEASQGDTVCLETFADVGVERPDGNRVAEESKSNLATNPLSDRSVEFWKTIRNWVEAIANESLNPTKTEFNLFVMNVASGTIAKSFHEANCARTSQVALESAKAILNWTGSNLSEYAVGLRPHLKIVLETDPKHVCELICRFQIVDGQGDLVGHLRGLMLAKLVSNEACDDIIKWAHGWVKNHVEGLLISRQLVRISQEEFHDALGNYVRTHDRASMLRSIAGKPSSEEVQNELGLKIYVRQAKIVMLDDEVILRAVNDFLAASADRTFWAESGHVSESDLHAFADELTAAWILKKMGIATRHDDRSAIQKGKLLYADCMDIVRKLGGLDVPNSFGRGSLHALADDMKIGWHPEFQAILQLTDTPAS